MVAEYSVVMLNPSISPHKGLKTVKKLRVSSVLVLLALLLALSVSLVYAQEEPFTVSFLLADSPTDQGWNAAHYRGIEALKTLGTVTAENGLSFSVEMADGKLLDVQVVENIGYNDADIERVARQVIDQGADYVFGTWFDAQGAMSRLAEEFPDVLFEHGSGYPFVASNGSNFSTYFIRIEESDYVAGYVTGLLGYTEVGLVGTYSIPEPVRGVNGFALGLQAGLEEIGLDPALANVQVIWINSWLDRELETQSAQALLDEGYVAIRQMADTPYSSQTTCEQEGAIAIGYGSDVSAVAPCALLTNEWNWGVYYTSQIQAALDGTWASHDWWGGFADGALIVTGWNDTYVAPEVHEKAEALIASMEAGEFNPFCGPISGTGASPDGGTVEVSVPEGKCLSDMDLLTMQWYVNGVSGEYPAAPPEGFTLELVDAPA
jgi:basic membrane lipoprotein Med (substrate-binding protein (PBP1-ABC) superfamily)